MILTVTLNPSVDIGYKMDGFTLDTVNRVTDIYKTPGGKGLNVTRILRQLEEDVAATGFLGGSLGNFIRSEMSVLGICDLFVGIEGDTRNCIAIVHEGEQTEILENGPKISKEEGQFFLQEFSDYVKKSSIVTISGSLPKGLADNYYNEMLEIANQRDVPVILDTKGNLLAQALQSERKPYLIKPNQEELADLLGEKDINTSQLVKALQLKQFEGVPWIVVTLGADGAIVKHENKLYHVTAPKIDAVNPVGSGDSVVAGFAAGISREFPDTKLIKFGLAMGVLNAMEEKTGFINTTNIEWCINKMEVKTISSSN